MTEQERPASPKESAIPAVPTAPALPAATPRMFERPTPDDFESPLPVASDGIAPVSSLLAQAIAKSSEAVGSSAIPHPDALDALAMRITSNFPKPPAVAEQPPTPANPPVPANPRVATNPPAPPVSIPDQAEDAELKSMEWPKEPFELTIRPTPKATNEPARVVPSKLPHVGKGSPMSGFTAGIVVGCVVLATVGGGLVATGRLRLVQPSSPASIAANAAPAVSNVNAESAQISGHSSQIGVTAPSGLITAQTPTASMPTKAQPAGLNAMPPAAPAATAPIRKEPVRKELALKTIVEKPSATPSKASTARPQNAASSIDAVEAAAPSELAPKSQPNGSIQLAMTGPIERAQEAPASADTQVPSVPAGVAQSLPELGAEAPAAVSQVTAPSTAKETFASPQMEEKPAPAKRTTKTTQSSASVFAAPDTNGAKPSSVDPAKLLLFAEPVYPAAARAARVQGNVDVLATIGKDGVPRSLQAVNGDPRLAAAAIAAISNWRYRPAMLNGQPEESLITITVKFAL